MDENRAMASNLEKIPCEISHRFPLIMTKEIKNTSHSPPLPPLIPMNCLKSEGVSDNIVKKRASDYSIDSILSDGAVVSKLTEGSLKNIEANKQVKSTKMNNFDYTAISKRPHHEKIPSYTCMIGQAILNSRGRKVTLGEIYEFIERNFPAIEEKVKGWRNCVRHNLSLNECFIKVGPSKHGRGNNWTVHPSYMESFLQGHFRKRMASRRKKDNVQHIPGLCKSNVDGDVFLHASSLLHKRYGIGIGKEVYANYYRYPYQNNTLIQEASFRVRSTPEHVSSNRHLSIPFNEQYLYNTACTRRKYPQGFISPLSSHGCSHYRSSPTK